MKKFLLLFNAPEPMSAFMARSTPQERQAGLEAWNKWRLALDPAIHFEFGAVVQAFERIQQTGIATSNNQTTNYAFAEATSRDDVIEALAKHPHLQRKDATIDILEMLPMPGQE